MALTPLMWVAIGVICIGLEIVVPGFIIFWFGLGALLTSAGIFLGLISTEDGAIQWAAFFILSLMCAGGWHFYLKKMFRGKEKLEERDPTLKELKGRVIKVILPHIPGEVELYNPYHGIKRWQAEADEIIEEGCEVVVHEARGIRLYVTKMNK
ncbi:MAG: NfeD family protein [Spirochaetes bacterium]|nr:NfeD family protein [Spirochaetota bacterium]